VPGRWIGDVRGGDDDLAVAPQDRTVFVPTPDRPVSLWVVGDSLTDTLGPALVNRSEATGVAAARFDIQYSSGLTRPQILDWPRRFTSVLAADPADIVVFMVGANDAQPIETEGRWVGLDDPAWAVEYRSRVREAIDTLTAWTATVVWVGQPVPRNADAARTMAMMNEIYRGEAAGRDDVLYVDAWAIFAGEDGGYEPYLRNGSGDRVLMRRPDGVHLTLAGGEHLAGVVLETLRQVWAIPG
jgi:hypothetical protein